MIIGIVEETVWREVSGGSEGVGMWVVLKLGMRWLWMLAVVFLTGQSSVARESHQSADSAVSEWCGGSD